MMYHQGSGTALLRELRGRRKDDDRANVAGRRASREGGGLVRPLGVMLQTYSLACDCLSHLTSSLLSLGPYRV